MYFIADSTCAVNILKNTLLYAWFASATQTFSLLNSQSNEGPLPQPAEPTAHVLYYNYLIPMTLVQGAVALGALGHSPWVATDMGAFGHLPR